MKAIYPILLACCVPIFVVYFLACLLSPLVRRGKIREGRGVKFHIVRDAIHSDYLFDSDIWKEEFKPKGRYVKIGWGDRRIFLEIRYWSELSSQDILSAFFGLNPTVLRVEFLDEVPNGSKEVEASAEQLEVVKDHIKGSFSGGPIRRMPDDYQGGEFYESDLRYNCFANCNNWVNKGLRLAGLTNKLWCPISHLI